jgi:mRNA interferase MazF
VFKRGDIVTIGVQGDFGKPRPALLIQSEMFNEAHATLTVLLISSELIDAPLFRLTIEPDQINGLTQQSQIQVDKAMTVRREKVEQIIGRVDDAMMVRVNRALALWIGLA